MKYVRITLGVIAALAVIAGVIWIFQGINVLPGSFMTGHIQWTWYGAGLAAVGAAVFFWATRAPGVMKAVGGVLGVLMVLMGGVWILQGINVLPGSFMTGHMDWAYRGGILAVIGLALLFLAMRKGGAKS